MGGSTFWAKFVAGAGMLLISATAPALDLTAGAGPAQGCPNAPFMLSLSAASVGYLQPAPVVTYDRYGGGEYAPSAGNNVGIAVGFAEASADISGWCVGALYRAEFRASASRDLLDVLVSNHFGQPFDSGRTYHLALTEESFEADGLRLRKVLDFDLRAGWTLNMAAAVSALQGLQGRNDSLSGAVTATSASYAVGVGVWDQIASNLSMSNFNPFVAPGHPSGYGYSTDFELVARSAKGLTLNLTVIDALGRLYWREVPQSLRTLNNAQISYNADFDRDAFVQGIDSRGDFIEHLSPKYQATVTQPLALNLSAVAEDDFVDGLHFPSLGAQFGGDRKLAKINYDIRTRAVGFGGVFRAVSALLTTNNLHVQRATVLGVSLEVSKAWR